MRREAWEGGLRRRPVKSSEELKDEVHNLTGIAHKAARFHCFHIFF